MAQRLPPDPELAEARAQLARFLRRDCPSRLFRHPISSPARPTGFCACDRSPLAMLRLWLRGTLLELILHQPSNRLKLALLRALGARVGRDVHIAIGVSIDPVYPQLITLEDGVFLGVGARLFTHEYRRDEYRAGRVLIRRGAFIGGGALLACGLEVGENATVAAGAVLARDVPPGATAIGNPARIVSGPGSKAG